MEYFLLKMNHDFPFGIQSLSFTPLELHGDMPTVKKVIKKGETAIHIFPDYLTTFTTRGQYHLVSHGLKSLLELYLPEIVWVPCVLVTVDDEQHLYWFMKLQKINAIHPHTQFDHTGLIQTLVLNKKAIPNGFLAFEICTEKQRFFIFRLEMIESILRRKFFGLQWVRLQEKISDG